MSKLPYTRIAVEPTRRLRGRVLVDEQLRVHVRVARADRVLAGSPAKFGNTIDDWVTNTWVVMKTKVAPGVEPATV